MNVQRQLLTPREAAHMLGISYPTIKKWILEGSLKTTKTPGGHHRLTAASVKAYLAGSHGKPESESREAYRLSGMNELAGEVVNVRLEGLMAEVVLAVGGLQVKAIITAEAANELQLKTGDSATALIRPTDVMIRCPADHQQ